MKLTGQQRATLVNLWIKRGKDMPLDQFIKSVCKAKGLEIAARPKLDKKFN